MKYVKFVVSLRHDFYCCLFGGMAEEFDSFSGTPSMGGVFVSHPGHKQTEEQLSFRPVK